MSALSIAVPHSFFADLDPVQPKISANLGPCSSRTAANNVEEHLPFILLPAEKARIILSFCMLLYISRDVVRFRRKLFGISRNLLVTYLYHMTKKVFVDKILRNFFIFYGFFCREFEMYRIAKLKN